MLVSEGVAYFDNLTLRALTEPRFARFANVSFGNLLTGNSNAPITAEKAS